MFQVDAFKETLINDEQKMGADIVKRALAYPIKLVSENAGVNGSVVMQRILDSDDPNMGYNAATGVYENLMEGGIIDPSKVIRCAMENASSVARTFLISDVVVCDIPEPEGAPAAAQNEMGGY